MKEYKHLRKNYYQVFLFYRKRIRFGDKYFLFWKAGLIGSKNGQLNFNLNDNSNKPTSLENLLVFLGFWEKLILRLTLQLILKFNIKKLEPITSRLGGRVLRKIPKFNKITSPQRPPEGEKICVTKLNFGKKKHIGFFGLDSNLATLIPILMLFMLNACDISNPEEAIPAYLKIENFDFSTTLEQGTDSEQITDVWVFVNDLSLGIYELPATIPSLEVGNQNITVFPVIRENGVRSTPIIYPFYNRFETTLELIPGEITTLQPTSNSTLV